MFRAQLILHNKVREVFEQSLRLAREAGYLKPGRGMRVALDTTYILGRGAVKDTYNLLADGIMKLMWALATVDDVPVRQWAEAHGYLRYAGSSVKGDAAMTGQTGGRDRSCWVRLWPTPTGCWNWPDRPGPGCSPTVGSGW